MAGMKSAAKNYAIIHAVLILAVFLALIMVAHRTIYGSPTRRQVLASDAIEHFHDGTNDVWKLMWR